MTSAIPAELQDALAGSLSIEREIGRGGMGVVYLARDVMLDRPLALKVLHPHLAADPEQRARFLREARTGARLSHPHIVPIYDVGEAAGHVWFTMAFVDGESLATVLTRRGTLPAATVERLLREVGWALANAHRRDVLHRDVSLDNILIERSTGRALLADFGIAARIEGGSAGPLIGTPAYMAPELVHGEPASPRSDLYALGIVAWSALTGYLPFSGDDAAEVLLAQVRDEVPSLARAAAGTPSRLRRAIEAVLAKAPDERPDSVEAWLATLDEPRQRRALAPVLSRWVRVREAVAPYRALAATLLAMFSGVALHLASFGGVTSYFLLLVAFGALLVPGLAILQAGLSLRALRLAAREGFHLEDLRLGLEQELAERRRARDFAA
ncbi:MAG: serine/threonine protein kinase, partial [Gemmatimonadetes bacterium]|nr:serine/threonine protein kinase [Gemmatimonadota bacterium]